MATKKISGYKIDFATNTLTMNYKFHAASQEYGNKKIKQSSRKLNLLEDCCQKLMP